MNNAQNHAEINGYLLYLQTQRKCSAHTISNYQRDLQQLEQLTSEHGAALLAGLSHFELRRFTSTLHARGMSPTSIARKLSAWRGFFNWLSEQGKLKTNPVDGVKPPKRAKSLPKALSVDDAVHLVSGQPAGADQSTPEHLCNHAMFEMLYSSGLRVSELTSLDVQYVQRPDHVSVSWIDFDAAEVIVTGKGNKRRSVPVGSAAIQALKSWLAVRNALLKSSDPADSSALFLTARGKRMSPRAVQSRIKAHALALGIPSNVHPHVLRHSFASHMLQSSGDLRAVQEMLGHASIASTQVYTSLDFQRLAQVYDAAHPRAKKQTSSD